MPLNRIWLFAKCVKCLEIIICLQSLQNSKKPCIVFVCLLIYTMSIYIKKMISNCIQECLKTSKVEKKLAEKDCTKSRKRSINKGNIQLFYSVRYINKRMGNDRKGGVKLVPNDRSCFRALFIIFFTMI